MHRLTVDIADALYERLRLAAFKRRETISETVRTALDEWLPEEVTSEG